LKVTAPLAGRFQSVFLEKRRQVGRGRMPAATAGLAPFEGREAGTATCRCNSATVIDSRAAETAACSAARADQTVNAASTKITAAAQDRP
jgi:hypothetical protein